MALIYHEQLGGKKNLLQIELNENLRRKRDELHARIEALGEPDIDDMTAGEDLQVRLRELQSINASIENLTKRLHGRVKFTSSFS